jgi:hypothetical protein
VTSAASGHPDDRAGRRSPRTALRRLLTPVDLVDVFAYVVVLNLAIEYLPDVISETFTISLLTAVLLKVVLEVVVAVKERVVSRFRAASTRAGKVLSAVSLWLVAVGSKFLVLELVDLVFRGSVELGGFIQVTLLVLTLLACRALVRRLLVPGSPVL